LTAARNAIRLPRLSKDFGSRFVWKLDRWRDGYRSLFQRAIFAGGFFAPTDFYLLVTFVTLIFSNKFDLFFFLFIIRRLKSQSKISANINSIVMFLFSHIIESLMGRATGPKRQQSRITTSRWTSVEKRGKKGRTADCGDHKFA